MWFCYRYSESCHSNYIHISTRKLKIYPTRCTNSLIILLTNWFAAICLNRFSGIYIDLKQPNNDDDDDDDDDNNNNNNNVCDAYSSSHF